MDARRKSEEDRRSNFVRLAEARVKKAIKGLRLIGNLANRSAYEYSDADLKKIFSALEHELRLTKDRFSSASTGASSSDFKLED